MPELAEVALYARDLNLVAEKSSLSKITLLNRNDWGDIIVPQGAKKAFKLLVGRRVRFSSSGKGLFLTMCDEEAPILEFRLGMTGQFQDFAAKKSWKRHYFLKLQFGKREILFADPRRFSRVRKPVASEFSLGGLNDQGLWMSKDMSVPDGYLKSPRISWLLQHGEVTGVGNYMANEALGRLNLSPFLPCKDLREARRILRKCQEIAIRSYKCGGNSFGSGYFQLNGTEGNYLRYCRFYQNPNVKKEVFRGRPVFSNFSSQSKFSRF